MIKKMFNIAILSIFSILVLKVSPVFAQNINPVGMQYMGSQQYIGQSTTVVNPYQRTQYVAPSINSIYAKPMQRVNEIPLYGKNKSTYFYAQPKKDEGLFAGSGLYMFASFSTGKTEKGVNIDHKEIEISGESDANDSMGTATGFSLGVGRVMSNSLSVEFMYSSYNGMKYGNWAQYYEEGEAEESEDEEEEEEENTIMVKNDTTYEIIDGGGITSQFIGLGFKYNLERVFGSIAGRLKPYFGFHLGIAQNTIKDYKVNDDEGYLGDDYVPTEEDIEYIEELNPDEYYYAEEYYNGESTFIGKTTRSFAGGIEAGFTVELEGNLSVDIFYKLNRYGKVETSGNVLSIYDMDTTEFYKTEGECADGFTQGTDDIDGYIICVADNSETIDGIQSLTQRRVQSGDMTFRQYGIKLKYMF